MIDPLTMIGGQQATELGMRRSHGARKDAPVRAHRERSAHASVARRRRSTARLLHTLAEIVGGERRDLATDPC
jgi:hypothetical protein